MGRFTVEFDGFEDIEANSVAEALKIFGEKFPEHSPLHVFDENNDCFRVTYKGIEKLERFAGLD